MTFIGFVETWQQAVTWCVLIVVLYAIVSGRIRYDLAAFGGLLLLGILGLRKPAELFTGFSSPALFTIAVVLVMSAGIVESGLLTGLGQMIAARVHRYQNQIFAVFISTGLMSAFMNNVGAVSIVLPTARRMAQRAKVPESHFGIPILYASILGGSLTLIGTASNLIVSSYRVVAFGLPFKMFDFIYHGLAMLLAGVLVLFLCRVCGFQPLTKRSSSQDLRNPEEREILVEAAIPRDSKKSLIVVATLVPIVILTAIGLIHPSIGFGAVVLIWLFTHVMPYQTALTNINLPIIIFLGSMFGISGILEETGALEVVVSMISPLFTSLTPFWLILTFLFATVVFANILDNSVAALLMAPVAVALWKTGGVPFNPDALLMAVAAGASLGLVLPSHQATLVVMNSMDFPRKSFIATGAIIAFVAGIMSALIIYTVWC